MLEILLIRPGSTEFDQQGRIQGTLDIPLCAAGADEVAQMARTLEGRFIEAIYSADCQAAEQSAAAISKVLQLRVKKLDQLHNLNHGLWQGMQIEEVKKRQPKVYRQWQDQPECVCPPEGEMVSEARDRIEPILARLVRRHREGVIGLVAPEPLASLIKACLLQTEIGDLWKATVEHGSWERIAVQPETLARR